MQGVLEANILCCEFVDDSRIESYICIDHRLAARSWKSLRGCIFQEIGKPSDPRVRRAGLPYHGKIMTVNSPCQGSQGDSARKDITVSSGTDATPAPTPTSARMAAKSDTSVTIGAIPAAPQAL